jgi:geranylgeranyl reductase family protein
VTKQRVAPATLSAYPAAVRAARTLAPRGRKGRGLSETEFDVVVVGCGPAGNTVAYRLASAGVRVLMVEKEALPRHKVCGGGLSRKTLAELPFSVAPVVEREIAGTTIAFRARDPIYLDQPGIGAMVQRDRFDHFMTQKALGAGAKLWDACAFERFEASGDAIVAHTGRGRVGARVLVGADGVQSPVRRQLYPGRPVILVPALEALLVPRPGMLELLGGTCVFDLGAIPSGYAWVFPKRDHFNIGLYRFRKRRNNLAMKQLLEDFIANTKILRDPHSVTAKAQSIPIKAVAKSLAKGRVVLVGDAGGVGEAFYGEGIYYAVRSANLAATAILGELNGRADLAVYDRAMRPLHRNLAYARLTARLFYLSPRLAFRVAVPNPRVSALFAGVIAGTVSPARCFWSFLLLTPHWLTAKRMEPIRSPLFD